MTDRATRVAGLISRLQQETRYKIELRDMVAEGMEALVSQARVDYHNEYVTLLRRRNKLSEELEELSQELEAAERAFSIETGAGIQVVNEPASTPRRRRRLRLKKGGS